MQNRNFISVLFNHQKWKNMSKFIAVHVVKTPLDKTVYLFLKRPIWTPQFLMKYRFNRSIKQIFYFIRKILFGSLTVQKLSELNQKLHGAFFYYFFTTFENRKTRFNVAQQGKSHFNRPLNWTYHLTRENWNFNSTPGVSVTFRRQLNPPTRLARKWNRISVEFFNHEVGQN